MAMANESERNLQNEQTLFHDLPQGMKNYLPNFFLSIKLKYVKLGYHYLISNAFYLLLVPLICIMLTHLSTLTADDFFQQGNDLRFNFGTLLLCLVFLVLTSTIYLMSRPRKVYLVDFACYKPVDPSEMCSGERILQTFSKCGLFSEETLAFLKKFLERSGVGSMAYAPKWLLDDPMGSKNMAQAMKESETVIVRVVDEVLAKTGVNPRDIGILMVNSSLFNPTPSLSAMVVNRFKLRSNILSYNFGGMGCSASLISVDLAKKLLQEQRNTYALVVSTENITVNWYGGNDRSMLLTNCLFRLGGSAILLSNRSSDRRRSKYDLVHTLRTHNGADDKSHNCVSQQEDESKNMGLKISKDLMTVAGEALQTNITILGPLVLPMSEQLLFAATLIARKIFRMKIKPYIPDFKLAFEHFCLHTGGRAVLDELEKQLKLTEWLMEPSRMTLYRFGHTSSSGLWYELAYFEAKGRIRKGDRTWQMSFGTGFKCVSLVCRALKTINPVHEKNPWMDEIDNFPVHVPKVVPIDF